jgi:hypothetical protein
MWRALHHNSSSCVKKKYMLHVQNSDGAGKGFEIVHKNKQSIAFPIALFPALMLSSFCSRIKNYSHGRTHTEAASGIEGEEGEQEGRRLPTLALELREVYVRYREGACCRRGVLSKSFPRSFGGCS